MQQIVMSRPALTRVFMSKAPASLHEKGGLRLREAALALAVSRTAAYPRFLTDNGWDPSVTPSAERWAELPIMDKANYIQAYPRPELVLDGKFHSAYTIEKSSGHSGGSYYWFRTPEEDALFPAYLEFAFTQFYKIDTIPTLVIIGLALGTWTSGEKMAQALREVAATGKYPLTVMAVGNKADEIIEIVRDLSPEYGQTVIVGYPPFVKYVIDEGAERGIDWKAAHVKIGLGGEGYSEAWRDYIAGRIGIDPTRDLLAVSGGYGAADLGMSVGREYPLTVLIRKLCTADPDLAASLFGSGVPNLFQYSPSTFFIEAVDGEVVFTVKSGIPLVRYNIHDQGGVISFERVMTVLASFGYDVPALLAKAGYSSSDIWRLPFFYVYGRTDGTVIIGGANVHPDYVSAALSLGQDAEIVGFKMEAETDRATRDERLHIALEHRSDTLSAEAAAAAVERYREMILTGLQQFSSEYADLHKAAPHLAVPRVEVYPRGTGPFAEDVGRIKRDYRL